MRKVNEDQGAAIARAYNDMAACKIVVVTTPDGTRAQIIRIMCGAETINGPIEDFEQFDSFDTIEEAKDFLKSQSER